MDLQPAKPNIFINDNNSNKTNQDPFIKSQIEFGNNSTLPQEINKNSSNKDDYSYPVQGEILKVEKFIFVDPKELKCNMKMLEKASFYFKNPTNVIYYTIISKRLPFFNFYANINKETSYNDMINQNTKITSLQLYQDKYFKERTFMDDNNNTLVFRDRWVIEVNLTHKIANIINIDFTYFGERAVIVNELQNYNVLKIDFFNPYAESYPLKINTILSGYNSLKTDSSELVFPIDSTIQEYSFKRDNKIFDKGIMLSSERTLETHSQFEYEITLPYEIKSCEGNILLYIYNAFVIMTLVFILLIFVTIYRLIKE